MKESVIELTDWKYQTADTLKDNGADRPRKSGAGSIKKSGKVSQQVEAPKNYPLSYAYGGVSALALGASLFFSADLGTRHSGFYGPASVWPGCLLTWLLFHLKDWILWKMGKVPDEYPAEPWLFSKKRSMYYELFFIEDNEG